MMSAVQPEYSPVIPLVFNVVLRMDIGLSLCVHEKLTLGTLEQRELYLTYLSTELRPRFHEFRRICNEATLRSRLAIWENLSDRESIRFDTSSGRTGD